MQKIKTLIFDFGDVFINLDKKGAMQNALNLFNLETFESDMIEINILYEIGKISTSEFIEFYKSKFQNLNEADIINAWNYIIKDFSGKTYLTQTETIKVNKKKTYLHIFETENLPPGDYIVGVEVIYAGGVATASSQFRVVLKEPFVWWTLIVALIIVFVFVAIAAKFYKKRK